MPIIALGLIASFLVIMGLVRTSVHLRATGPMVGTGLGVIDGAPRRGRR